MNISENIKKQVSESWGLDQITISHSVIDYHSFGINRVENDSEFVRLHFGLKGSYSFKYKQLNNSVYNLSGHHNNLMYSKGMDLEIHNKSKRIETFGINFHPETFIAIAQNGNNLLKKFAERVAHKENIILSEEWRTNSFKIQQVVQEVIDCPYTEQLRNLFLLSKSIELLVLQAEIYDAHIHTFFIKSISDKNKLIEAKELLANRLENPPTISALAKEVSMNEFKLKKGFKELFGTTIFGYIHGLRMGLAKQLLLDTELSAKEVAFETGYSSPQHFSKAFKKEFGQTPSSVRKNPDSAIH